jgi:hypothetical protein
MKIPQIKINKERSLPISKKSVDDKNYKLLSNLLDMLDNINTY